MADHAHEPRALREFRDRERVFERVRERDFHLHVFARVQALQGLGRMHLRRGRENDGIDSGTGQCLREIRGRMRNAVLAGHLFRGCELAPHHRHHLDAVDQLAGIQMLLAEGADAGDDQLHGPGHGSGSTMRCPTAVFDAGT